MPDRMPDRMPEDMSDRMPEDLPVRKSINVMVGITRSKVIIFFCTKQVLLFEIQPSESLEIVGSSYVPWSRVKTRAVLP